MEMINRLRRFLATSIPKIVVVLFAGIFSALPVGAQVIAPQSLKDIPVVEPSNLDAFVKDGEMAIVLGKALFWDMQVGSDNVQACASCHFSAGGDTRRKNQLTPGLGVTDIFGNTGIPGIPGPNQRPWNFGFGPNFEVTAEHFPFHRRTQPTAAVDPADEFANVILDTNDVMSSQGVREEDIATPFTDPTFNWKSANQRRVAPRNAPSMINAVFHLDMFWDGRASFVFNGVNPFGFRDRASTVKLNTGTAEDPVVQDVIVRIPFAAHASQSVGPPLSTLEMTGHSRNFLELAEKLLSPTLMPLGMQVVHPQDSVLGPYANAAFVLNKQGRPTGRIDERTGLDTTYEELIQQAFRDEWWNADISQMKDNFTLFFGLAMQLYQGSLVSDDTPFDRFMGAPLNVRGGGVPIPPDPTALTPEEQLGLDIFQGTHMSGLNPTFINGQCNNCHLLPESTNHTVRLAQAVVVSGGPNDLINEAVPQAVIEVMPMGIFVPPATAPAPDAVPPGLALYDVGFYNIGVRPTAEDLGRFGKAPPTTGFDQGLPFSYVELARMKEAGLLPADIAPFVPDIPALAQNVEIPLADGTVVLIDDVPTAGLPTITQGAFKVPSLRNQEFQGPYFRNGGDATLRHVVEFYVRGGNFPQTNIEHLDADIGPIPELMTLAPGDAGERNIRALVAFLSRGLTDPRVANERAPFDHPQLFIPEGVTGKTPDLDKMHELKATGAAGGKTIPRFLNLDPQMP